VVEGHLECWSSDMDELEAFCLEISGKIGAGLTLYIVYCPRKDDQSHAGWDNLFSCGPAILDLLLRQANILCRKQCNWTLLEKRLDDLISLATEKLYAYPFKDVPECWRRLFTDASILKACSLVVRSRLKAIESEDLQDNVMKNDSNMLDAVVKILDLAVIMAGAPGGPVYDRRDWIEKAMDLLEPLCEPSPIAEEEARPSKRRKVYNFDKDDIFPGSTAFVPSVQYPVTRAVLPTFNEFAKHMAATDSEDIGPRPLIIQEAIEYWPARNERPWKRPSYLLSRTLNGRRLVPVEVGRSYVDDGWGQKIIPFKDFMNDYLIQSPASISASNGTIINGDNSLDDNTEEGNSTQGVQTGYLAQHDLFTQIQSLRFDISIPDYCYVIAPPPHPSSPLASKHSAIPTLEEPLLNAWLGPAGTISPMHVDPYHNILAQVVGRKYIRLYAPRESAKLYPRGIEDGGVDMCNTSALDIGVLEGWDGTREEQREALRKYTLYSSAEYVDLVLEEGECLYIPLGWWHYVRSLSVSFSVSFWWN
jgi:hypothetical protein